MDGNEERLKEIAAYERKVSWEKRYRAEREERERLAREKTARVQAAWDKYVVPVLEEHGFEIEVEACGYEVDGSALWVTYNGESAYLYQDGDI